ncbi:MAG: hypothetical protein QHH06_10230 [Clostridiales bacterium]|jgi:hypothetical protein|nr:hypothetical protein [Eubacteriales bacterium]MDH7566842.1 hypothetical protein [Clostridiales bacterium]
MKEFFVNNWPTIVIILLLLGYIVYLAVTKQWAKLREMAYKIMLAAEKVFATGEGQKKFDYVFDRVYSLVPAWLKLFLPPEELKRKLQEWYILSKDYMDDGKVNHSITG